MKNLNLNHHEVLKAIFSCRCTNGILIITNTLNKEWDYSKGSKEVFEGKVVISFGGISNLTVTFNSDTTVSFQVNGTEKHMPQQAADFIINEISLQIIGKEGFLDTSKEPNYGMNTQYESGLDNLADRSVYDDLIKTKKTKEGKEFYLDEFPFFNDKHE